MKKINIFALIGIIFFNLTVMLGVILTVLGLLFALWVCVGSFIISPILVLLAHVLGLQAFTLLQGALSAIFCITGILLLPQAFKLTHKAKHSWREYKRFNQRTIYSK